MAKLETTVIDVLPALYEFTGCEKTTKICSKSAALKIGETEIVENLVTFGKIPINEDVIIATEMF